MTDARGRFSMAVLSLPVTTQFRARVTDRAGIVSPVLPVGARAVVGTRVTSTSVRRGGRVHFSGTVRPSEPGRGIAIQKRRDGRWITVAGTVARPGGGAFAIYGKTIRVSRGGLYRVFLGSRQRRDRAERRADDPHPHAPLTGARTTRKSCRNDPVARPRGGRRVGADRRLRGEAVRYRSTSRAGARWALAGIIGLAVLGAGACGGGDPAAPSGERRPRARGDLRRPRRNRPRRRPTRRRRAAARCRAPRCA